MASEFYGLNRGSNLRVEEVTVGTSTGSTDLELRVDLTKGITRKDVNRLLDTILNFINDGRKTQIKI